MAQRLLVSGASGNAWGIGCQVSADSLLLFSLPLPQPSPLVHPPSFESTNQITLLFQKHLKAAMVQG